MSWMLGWIGKLGTKSGLEGAVPLKVKTWIEPFKTPACQAWKVRRVAMQTVGRRQIYQEYRRFMRLMV
jgi:hypothetical protein